MMMTKKYIVTYKMTLFRTTEIRKLHRYLNKFRLLFKDYITFITLLDALPDHKQTRTMKTFILLWIMMDIAVKNTIR